MSFNKCILPCDPNPYQDTEHDHHHGSTYALSGISLCLTHQWQLLFLFFFHDNLIWLGIKLYI